MVSIKKRRNKGYILLESLLATALFAFIVSLVLTEIANSRKRQILYLQEEEAYQAAKTAVQTGRDSLHLNGQKVTVSRTDKSLKIYKEGELLIEIAEN